MLPSDTLKRGKVREALVFKLLSEWIQRHIELIKQNFIKLTTGIWGSNLKVTYMYLAPVSNRDYCLQVAQQHLLKRLQKNPLSSNYSWVVTHWLTCTILKTGVGTLVSASLNFQCGDINVFFESFWTPCSHFLDFVSSNIPIADAVVTAPMRKLWVYSFSSLNLYISETVGVVV
jgi:hypothetical protein